MTFCHRLLSYPLPCVFFLFNFKYCTLLNMPSCGGGRKCSFTTQCDAVGIITEFYIHVAAILLFPCHSYLRYIIMLARTGDIFSLNFISIRINSLAPMLTRIMVLVGLEFWTTSQSYFYHQRRRISLKNKYSSSQSFLCSCT